MDTARFYFFKRPQRITGDGACDHFQMRCPECFSSITKVYNHECPRLYPIPKTEKEAQRFVWAHYQQRPAGIGFEIINEGSTDAFSDQEAKLHATRSASVGDWGKAWRDATGEFIRGDGRSDGWIKFNGNKRLRRSQVEWTGVY